MNPVWIALAALGAFGIVFVFCVGHWLRHAEVGVDPFADLPTFDDDEAQRLLDAGC